MLKNISYQLLNKLLLWSENARQKTDAGVVERKDHPILIFFHGYSLAHTIRPLIIARSLRERGYSVALAGAGPYADCVVGEGFDFHPVETMPQSRMDDHVARGDYAYYDMEWIDRCVRAERELMRQSRPALVIGDMRPTLRVSAALEGTDVALVTQAYNAPGYPFRIDLGHSFPTEAGPFEDYLNQHGPGKPHSHIKLLADVPAFHPPGKEAPAGHHYVGPLLDSSPTPRHIPQLDDVDWDQTLPLIYLNCGSTGADPEYLQQLLDALARRPYRVLVTTAGRCTATPGPNAHITDFVPAEWVMRRAALFIGIGGIGSIYHALKQGVPVIGAPEHLDQEYHLNRVRDLELGYKLDWSDFRQPQRVLQAVDGLFADYASFRRNCRRFSRHLDQWQGGAAVADIVDQLRQTRQQEHLLATGHLMCEAEFVHQLDLSTPADLSRGEIRSMLYAGCQRGLPYALRDGDLFFDQISSWNWLYQNEPKFFASDYMASEQRRQTFLTRRGNRIQPRQETQRFRHTYTYRVYPHTLEPGQRAHLFIPYPIATPYQGDIELLGVNRGDMADFLCAKTGFFYNYPLDIDPAAKAPVDIEYCCEVTVAARTLAQAADRRSLSRNRYRRYTEVDPDVGASQAVAALRRELALAPGDSDLERARRIYRHLAESKRFKKIKQRSATLRASLNATLADDGGNCTSLSNAFIALCRLEGIPARKVVGALAGYPDGAGSFVASTYNQDIGGHTWAEIFIAGKGWIPVEFHGIAIGRNATTRANAADRRLRQLIAANGEAYSEFYFGNTDCHRVVYSNSVHEVPRLAVADRDAGAGTGQLTYPRSLKYECHLKMECC